ncbi:hypothetical protein VP01_657g8 [Puccinia sorghi]|uniref:Uncharacterized protein n=1 Tax=Puccinia sorghi TaxID=27349 RepID=A0A0L6UHF4_9BASI|nr:hypothetical protein VP01_657g8 [Puccinia sorghi]
MGSPRRRSQRTNPGGVQALHCWKKKNDKKTWKVVKSRNVFDIEVLYGLNPFDEFQEMVARKCNIGFPNTNPIVMKSIATGSPRICCIDANLNGMDYKDWLKSADDAKKSKVFLKLKMDNPADAIKDTEMEDLLAAQAAHEQAVKEMNSKQKLCSGDDTFSKNNNELDAVDWERINIHMKKIYDKNLPIAKYDCHLPVYIDPRNPHRYILITLKACQEWARALMERKEGVTPTSPPQLLFYLTLKGTKRAKVGVNDTPASSSGSGHINLNTSGVELLAGLLAGHHKNRLQSKSRLQTPLSSPPNKSHIKGYINFLGISNKEDPLNILLANGFTSHKVFKLSGLFRELGLTLGVIMVLFDNVAKYDHYLANHK